MGSQSRKRRHHSSPCDAGVAFAPPSLLDNLIGNGPLHKHAVCLGVGQHDALVVVDMHPCTSSSTVTADSTLIAGVIGSAGPAPARVMLHPAVEDFLLNMAEAAVDADIDSAADPAGNVHAAVTIQRASPSLGPRRVEDATLRIGQFAAQPISLTNVPMEKKLCIDLNLVHSDSHLFEQTVLFCSNNEEEEIMCVGEIPKSTVDAVEGMVGGGSSRHRALLSIHRCLAGRLVMEGSYIIVALSPIWSDGGTSWDLSLDPCSYLDDSSDVAIFLVDCVREIGEGERRASIPRPKSSEIQCERVRADDRLCYRVDASGSYSVRVFCETNRKEDQIETEEVNDEETLRYQNRNNATCPGYERLVDELTRLATIQHPSAAPSAVILTGCTGVGKTKMATCVAEKLLNLSYMTFPSVVRQVSAKEILLASASFVDIQDLIDFILTQGQGNSAAAAAAGGRRVLIIDDLDSVIDASGEETSISRNPERVLAMNAIVSAVDALVKGTAGDMKGQYTSSIPEPFILGLCCADAGQLPADLIRVGRFEKILTMSAPTQYQRERIFQTMLEGMPLVENEGREQSRQSSMALKWAETLAPRTAGFVAADIRRVCADALTRAQSRYLCAHMPTFQAIGNFSVMQARIQWEDVREAARMCVPSQLARLDVTSTSTFQEGDISVEDGRMNYKEVHKKAWSVFGGYDDAKSQVYRSVVRPWSRETMRQAISVQNTSDSDGSTEMSGFDLGILPPTGVLFYGPPGVGKSTAAQCLAASLALPVVKVVAADVLDQWLGGSEAAIRSLFARARSASPCILFFDDIDALASNRDEEGDSTNVQSRILSTLLNEMDGVSSHTGRGGVLVVAATNRLKAIDAALLRPGRLEEHIELQMPTASDIEEILRIHLAKVSLGAAVLLSDLAVQFEELGASGADVEGVCTGACLHAIRRASNDIPIGKEEEGTDIALTIIDFAAALRAIFPERRK